jgi:DNA-directed RNA polymerase subunit L
MHKIIYVSFKDYTHTLTQLLRNLLKFNKYKWLKQFDSKINILV